MKDKGISRREFTFGAITAASLLPVARLGAEVATLANDPEAEITFQHLKNTKIYSGFGDHVLSTTEIPTHTTILSGELSQYQIVYAQEILNKNALLQVPDGKSSIDLKNFVGIGTSDTKYNEHINVLIEALASGKTVIAADTGPLTPDDLMTRWSTDEVIVQLIEIASTFNLLITGAEKVIQSKGSERK